MEQHEILVNELKKLLKGGSAHVGFNDAVSGIPFDLVGKKYEQLPYSIWQLVEHIRIAQRDMLEFSKNGNYKSPQWPDGYWVDEVAPASETKWNESIKQIDADLNTFIALLETEDLFEKIPHGSGQNLLREALQIADHNAYHTAEIVIIRRLLNAWKS